ncbi:MAG: outer membrane lipoprotein-sorting protein [Firmicutes bacterium]|nr:outer membrane lipoprotein-sorting protein [Bacillota bacterium]
MKFKRQIFLLMFLFFCQVVFSSYSLAQNSVDVISMLRYVNSILMENNAQFKIKMVVTRGKKENEYYLTLWTKNRNFVTRTEKPVAQKGQIFLLFNKNCWIYYPKIDKTMKTAASQRLLGGDFSFVDMAAIDLLQDYNSEFINISDDEASSLLFVDSFLLEAIKTGYIIQCTVKDGKSVSYPKVRLFITDDRRPIRLEFYTISGQLMGVLTYQNYNDLNGKIRPKTMIMRTSLNKDNFTTMYYLEAKYDLNIPDIYFTETYMKSLSTEK